jgi:tRNA(Ile)-lysidine synthase
MFIDRLAQAASEKCGLRQDQPILLGVSGGSDSLALMFGLEALGYPLVIAHVDHALRLESQNDASFVQELADSRGWPFFSRRVNVREFADAEGQSIEEAARTVRYQFLFEQARLQGCQAVAVGHHADDQVETVLMHFVRGTALSGLTGMSYRRLMPRWEPAIPLVRPLLGVWREEIEAYVETLGITPCVDMTNLDTAYYRNRLRHDLIPELETYNPQIKTAIFRMADVLQEEANWMAFLTGQAYQACLRGDSDARIELSLPDFLSLPKALQRRVFREAVEQLRPDLRDVGFAAIERGVEFSEGAKPGEEIDLIARLNLAVVNDVLVLKNWTAELPDFNKPLLIRASFEATLDWENPVILRHGWRLKATLIRQLPESPLDSAKRVASDEAWLDYDCLRMPLLVRGPRAGDCFQPLGMDGHSQSLQDLFVNLKIPAHLRPIWPLVVAEEQIAWVVGLRPAEEFKITEKTQHILRIKRIKDDL